MVTGGGAGSVAHAVLCPVFFLFLPLFFFFQSPSAITYQATVRNTDGSVMANTALTLSFMIHDASAS